MRTGNGCREIKDAQARVGSHRLTSLRRVFGIEGPLFAALVQGMNGVAPIRRILSGAAGWAISTAVEPTTRGFRAGTGRGQGKRAGVGRAGLISVLQPQAPGALDVSAAQGGCALDR